MYEGNGVEVQKCLVAGASANNENDVSTRYFVLKWYRGMI
jgi:hypothetical protein